MSDWDNNVDADLGALGFDSETIEAPEFVLLPDGRYPLACTSARVEQSKNNPSTVMANIEETVLEGDNKGRKVWSRYIVAHEKPDVMARGRQDVKRMMQAYGVGGNSLTPMVGLECIGAVTTEPAKGDFPAKNKVSRREPSTNASPRAASGPASSRPAATGKAPPGFLASRKG
jgi:hypothetical protein